MPVARAGGFQGTDQRLSYVHDRATWHNFSTGPIQQTGNPLDVAIDGDAFLVVQTPRGERYTRNGALQINATGELVTSDRRPRARRRRADPVPADRQQHLDQSRRHHHGARGRQRHVRLRARQAAAGPLRPGRRRC